MGEIETASKDDAPKRKKLSTKVDLTPMVDLGFLLLTFFIFSMKIGEPKSMDLVVPKDTNLDSSKTSEDKTLVFILSDSNRLAYYEGSKLDQLKPLDYNFGIREAIDKKRKLFAASGVHFKELVVLIKPTKESSYKNIIDILDEMTINQVKRYVLMEPRNDEIKKAADLRVRS